MIIRNTKRPYRTQHHILLSDAHNSHYHWDDSGGLQLHLRHVLSRSSDRVIGLIPSALHRNEVRPCLRHAPDSHSQRNRTGDTYPSDDAFPQGKCLVELLLRKLSVIAAVIALVGVGFRIFVAEHTSRRAAVNEKERDDE